jgi:hypothetical protein
MDRKKSDHKENSYPVMPSLDTLGLECFGGIEEGVNPQ